MKRKLAFLTALIMGMSAVSVTTVVDSDYITASAETTTPELPELKKGEARVILTDYDTGEIIQFENADDEKRIVSMYADIRYRNMNDTGGDWVSTGPIYIIKSNPYYCDIAKFLDADFFDVSLPTNNLPEGYSLPDDYKVITKNDNGSLEIEFKLKKLPETIETGKIEGCTYTLSGNGTLTIDGYGKMCDFEKGTSPFCGNKSIRKVIFSKGITYVGENTFENCREDLVIYANENTGGQRYAKDNGIKFVSLGLRGDEFICNIMDYSGEIGDNITWENNICQGYMILFGEGEMENFAEGESSFSAAEELVIKNALILEGITSVGDYAFSNCKSLDVIKLSDSVNSIGKYAFSGCSLSILALPYSIESVDKGAFADCKNLKSVFIPYTVTEIGEDAFSGCNKDLVITGFEDSEAQRYAKENEIRFISLGKQTEQIITSAGECGENAIWTLDSEGTLTVSGKGDMYSYTYDFGAEEDKDVTPLFNVSDKVKKAVIEDGITNIGSHFFNSCVNMTEVSISDSVKTIGNGAFTYCTSLTDVTIPDSVTAIEGWGAFSYCKNLENVTIPPSVTSICDNIFFSEDSRLTTITGYEGTYAQEYSKKNGIKFISLGDTAVTTTTTTTPTTTTTTTTTTSEPNVSLSGDANCDKSVNMADAVLIMQTLANPDKYGINGTDKTHITEQGMKNADVNGEGVTNSDALEIQKFILKIIDKF